MFFMFMFFFLLLHFEKVLEIKGWFNIRYGCNIFRNRTLSVRCVTDEAEL